MAIRASPSAGQGTAVGPLPAGIRPSLLFHLLRRLALQLSDFIFDAPNVGNTEKADAIDKGLATAAAARAADEGLGVHDGTKLRADKQRAVCAFMRTYSCQPTQSVYHYTHQRDKHD